MSTIDPYVFPGTNVLRNRLGICDPTELARFEADVSTLRLAQLEAEPLEGAYDLAHLRAFHRHIFGDIYSWAGEIRTVVIAKGDSLFALPQHIETYLEDALAGIAREGYLRGLDRDRAVDRLAHYLAEINAAHPFRDGNGRTQRAFIGQLARQAGHQLTWQAVTPERNTAVSRASMAGDNQPLRALIDEITRPPQRNREHDLGPER